jgi:hypothetical protein
MANATTRVIEFPFTFRYPRKGIFEEANSITVCEPGFDKRNTYRKMSSIVMEAQAVAQKKFAQNPDENKITVEAPASEDGAPVEPKLPDDFDLMVIRMGLNADEYTRFCDWVQKELTNCKQLAFVGTDPDDKNPIVEEVWDSIARAGGMEAVDKVLSGFASFFSLLARPQSPTTTGMTPSLSSEAKATASSPTRKPRHSHTQS